MAASKKRAKKAGREPGKLEAYRGKRDFDRTSEPRGDEAPASTSGRLFVVQKHAARSLHYDFRLELDGVLKSWAVPRGPSLDPGQRPLAVEVEDHPFEYGSFEGVIPKGEYGAGTVLLWDRGVWEPIGDPAAGYERGDLKFRLDGEKLRGAWVLARMGGKAGEGGKNWLLIKKRDAEARPVQSFNVLAEEPRSVLSGRSLDEIALDPEAVWTGGEARPVASSTAKKRGPKGSAGRKEKPAPDPSPLPGARPARQPEMIRPQLASRLKHAPEGGEWLHEIKLDGYRLMCRLRDGEARLFTRNGHDWTDRMPEVARAARRLPLEAAFLDGEVVVLDADGISNFQALQNAFAGFTQSSFTYYLFDVPYAGGYDLRKVPLIERKDYLRRLLEAASLDTPTLQFCDHIVGKGPLVFEQAGRSGLEGIISKRAGSHYESRRTESWVKVKCVHREEFVVGGFSDPAGSRSGLGALLVGHHDETGRLLYCGRVGTGFSDETLELLGRELGTRLRETSPFSNPEADPDPGAVHWVDPDLVVEVEFGSWTREGLVRHASFQGLRPDVEAGDVVGEVASPRAGPARATREAAVLIKAPAAPEDAFVSGVRISHPDRTVYPDDGVTKREVAEYYEKISEWILPHVVKRPLSLVRCPLGLAGESFYQREIGEGFPEALRGITIGRGDSEDHAIVVDDLAGLISLVQVGVLEIHAWGCRADKAEKPDRLVFDLDPGPGILWEHVVESARFVADYLDNLGLASFVKTSGGKGLHVVVPLVRRSGWAEAKAFCSAIADDLVRIAPLNFVATMTKALRRHRIFIDYLRNQLGATSIAPYSTRALNGATVSTPLRWEELSVKLKPADLTITSVTRRLGRLKRDPWEGFHEVRQSITVAMKRKVGLGA